MLRYLVKRIIILIPVILAITVVLFGISKAMPGDPVRRMIPSTLRGEQYELARAAIEQRLGLDKSLPEQYVRWLNNIVLRGDFGYSTMFNRPVKDCIGEPLINTIILNLIVNFAYLAIALPVGIKMATKRGSLFDNGWQVVSLTTYSMPSFFLGLSLIFIFGIALRWLPLGGMPNATILSGADYYFAWARHLVLPVTTLTVISLASAIRYIRNAMIDALSQDYIRTARSKGLREKVVIYSHAFRNALIPISTVIVFTLFSLFIGSPITEHVFMYNGIGKLLVSAVRQLDSMMVIILNLLFAMVNVVAVLFADIIYGLVDPRVKLR